MNSSAHRSQAHLKSIRIVLAVETILYQLTFTQSDPVDLRVVDVGITALPELAGLLRRVGQVLSPALWELYVEQGLVILMSQFLQTQQVVLEEVGNV